MQVEILKFLLDARAHLQSGRRDRVTECFADLQAVDRDLPDCDWFELGEEPEAARRTANDLWAERSLQLEF
jgi:hypothetical protein